MSEKLTAKTCKACSGEATLLNSVEISAFLKELNGWNLSADQKWLFKEFKFKNFVSALEFVNKIGAVAENENHHPNIDFTWGYCKISIQTHKVNGLTENDFILAAKIDPVS